MTKQTGSDHLLAAFSSEDDLAAVLSGRFPRLQRHFVAGTDPNLETVTFDPELFGLLKQHLRSEYAGSLEKYRETITEIEKRGSSIVTLSPKFAGLKIGDLIPLGAFDETKDSICFSMLVRTEVASSNGKDKVNTVAVSAVSMTIVRERLLALTCGAMYRDKADIEWARHSLQRWRDRILTANSP